MHALASTARAATPRTTAPVGHARRAAIRRSRVLSIVCALGLALLVLASASVGTVDVTLPEAARIVLGHLLPSMPWMHDGSLSPLQDQAVWQFRLPRSLLSILAGAGLALAGALMQVTVRNPLAEPYILGVSSGASVGAVSVIVLGSSAVAGLSLNVAAFLGAVIASVAVIALSRHHGTLSPTRMILTGVALGTLFSAVTSYLIVSTSAQNVVGVMFFLLGSVSAASMSSLLGPAVALTAACLCTVLLSSSLNALQTGDDSAASLGIDVARLRGLLLVVVAALLTGTIVSVAGGRRRPTARGGLPARPRTGDRAAR